jgi:membrane associated rhomboid family serine protease
MQVRLSPLIKWVCISCFGFFLVQQTLDRFANVGVLQAFGLVPGLFLGSLRFWQIFTFPFLHADVLHLFFNLMMLAFIGSDLEFAWGKAKLIWFHLVCSTFTGIVYVLAQTFLFSDSGMMTPLIGISGSIYGMLVAYGLLYGERTMLFMMVFPLKAKHFVWILAAMELLTSLFSGRSGLSSLAHVAGMGAGFLFMLATRTGGRFDLGKLLKMPTKKRSSTRSSHLKLVVSKKGTSQDKDEDSKPRTWH